MHHHALLLLGSYSWGISRLPEVCRVEGPDTLHCYSPRVGISDVRTLIDAAYRTPLKEESRHFVIAFSDLTHEAQNALLKILEEPPLTARFYIITEKRESLLPTLRSRLLLYDEELGETATKNWDEFHTASYADRLAHIADRATKKDDVWLHDIMDGMEVYAEEKRDLTLLRALAELRPVFGTQGASKKMIIEHLSLLM